MKAVKRMRRKAVGWRSTRERKEGIKGKGKQSKEKGRKARERKAD